MIGPRETSVCVDCGGVCHLITHPREDGRWEVGDVAIYDNTAVLHRVVPYAADSGRLMERTTLKGEEDLV